MSEDERFIELWNDYLEGELDESGITELRHLLAKDDRRLQTAADSYRTHRLLGLHVQDTKSGQDEFVRETINCLPAEAAPFIGAVMRQLPPGRTRTARMRFGKWLAALAAAVLLLAGAYFLAPRVESEIAIITELNGAFQWTGDGGRVVRNLQSGSSLRAGTLELLSADSWSVLEFPDGSTVTISGQSALTLSDSKQKELYLREGSLSANVTAQPEGRPMLIRTPTAQLEVLGTQLNVDAERTSTTLQVNDGRVRVTRLADGSVTEVPADHQVLVSASRSTDFTVTRRPESVRTWRSNLPSGAIYGQWTSEQGTGGCLQTSPILLNYQKGPVTLHLAAISVSRGPGAPVALTSDGKFRVHGRMETLGDIYFSLTMKHEKGGFAGKYVAMHRVDPAETAGHLEIELHLEEFRPQEEEFADSPIGLELVDWSCFTTSVDTGLGITSVELLPAGPSGIVKPAAEPSPLPILDVWSAVAQGNLEAVRRHLAAGAEIDATFVAPGIPGSGATPLHLVVLCNHEEIAQCLIEKRANLNARARDEHGGTPLHWAAALGRLEMAERLIRAGADVNSKDKNGFTPLDATNYHRELQKEAKFKIAELLRGKGGKSGMTTRHRPE